MQNSECFFRRKKCIEEFSQIYMKDKLQKSREFAVEKHKNIELQEKLVDRVEDLTHEVKEIKDPPRSKVIKNEIIKGIFWALGKVLGFVIIIGVVYIIISNIDLTTGIGKWVAEIVQIVKLNI